MSGMIPIDLTEVGLKDGKQIGIITGVKLQVKSGEKWNNDGTTTIETVDEWTSHPRQASESDENGKYKALSRIALWIQFPESNNQGLNHHLYMSDASLPMLKGFLSAAGVSLGAEGFDPFNLLNCNIGCNVVTEENDQGSQQSIKSVYRA